MISSLSPRPSCPRLTVCLLLSPSRLAPIDDFIAGLWKVHQQVKAEGYVQVHILPPLAYQQQQARRRTDPAASQQDITLGLFRSDYMVHHPSTASGPTIRQVEFNTIASSFGGLASRVSSLHRYLLQTAAYPRAAAALIRPDLLPTNASIERLAAGLAAAHAAYGPPRTRGRLPCILFVVQDGERNALDQRHLEYAVFAQARAKVFRLPLAHVLRDTRLAAPSDADGDGDGDEAADPAVPHARALLYTPPAFPDRAYEATLVYLRAGYTPAEHATPAAWQARLQLERSAAIKCPSVLAQLAGSKKVQQLLAAPPPSPPPSPSASSNEHDAGAPTPLLHRFLPYPGIASRVAATFAPMHPLDSTSAAGRAGRALATDARSAARFVLKPQREGGGNNVYRGAIPGFLAGLPEAQWGAHILMEMMEPPAQRNAVLRAGKVQVGGVVCELGVYGVCMWRHGDGRGVRGGISGGQVGSGADEDKAKADDPGEVLVNEEAGYLLRTKGDASDEGGVAAGFGAVDSCVLVDV